MMYSYISLRLFTCGVWTRSTHKTNMYSYKQSAWISHTLTFIYMSFMWFLSVMCKLNFSCLYPNIHPYNLHTSVSLRCSNMHLNLPCLTTQASLYKLIITETCVYHRLSTQPFHHDPSNISSSSSKLAMLWIKTNQLSIREKILQGFKFVQLCKYSILGEAIIIIMIIIIIWFGDTVTVTHPTNCDTNSKVRAMSV